MGTPLPASLNATFALQMGRTQEESENSQYSR